MAQHVFPALDTTNTFTGLNIFGNTVRLTGSDYTNSTSGFTTVLQTLPLQANATYSFWFQLYYACSVGSTSLNLNITGPSSPTSIAGMGEFTYTQLTGEVSDVYVSGYGSLQGAGVDTANFVYGARFTGTIVNGSNAGALILQAKTGSGTLTIKSGSFGLVF